MSQNDPGLFVAVKVTPDTALRLYNFMQLYLPEISTEFFDPNDLHVTVMFSLTNVEGYEPDPDFITCSDDDYTELAYLGEPGMEALVLKFRSEALQQKHQQLRRMGAQFTYPQFYPHVSLSYGEKKYTQQEIDDLNRIIPSIPICVYNEYTKPLDPIFRIRALRKVGLE